MKVAIVGSREWADEQAVIDLVNSLPSQTRVISGGARGVDTFAERAVERRWDLGFQLIPADWDRFGKSAGMRRNAEIVAEADRVVAFWHGESKGTAHAIKLARQAGKPVEIHYGDGRVED